MATIKERYERFKTWKRFGTEFKIKDPTGHTCACCGHEYEGNFCPVCGQKAGERRITWAMLRESTLDLWGLGTRSMLYSIWQLLLRPGYFIADYITGKRQVSFPPVKMLFFVTVIVLLIESLFGVDTPEKETAKAATDASDLTAVVDITIDWLSEHPAWGALIMLSFFIIPTYLICRESPRCSRRTLPEGFFIQVFIAVQMSVWGLVASLLPDVPRPVSVAYTVIVMMGLVWFRTYYQLFGYSVWGTLWRLMAVWWNGLILIFTAAFIEIVIDRIRVRQLELTGEKIGNIIIGGLFMAAIAGTGLLIAWYIDHRRAKRATAPQEPSVEELEG